MLTYNLIVLILVRLIHCKMSPSWHSYECIQPANLTLLRLLMDDSNLYFFFKDFVIRLEEPMFRKTPLDEFYLTYKDPVYLSYDQVDGPSVLKLDHVLGSIQTDFNDRRKSYLILRDFIGNKYYHRVLELSSTIGEVGRLNAGLTNRIHSDEYEIAFFRYDDAKWLQIGYSLDNRIHFQFYKNDDQSIGELDLGEDYRVRFAVYYETKSHQRLKSFSGTVFEIDDKQTVHFNHFDFTVAATSVELLQHYAYSIAFEQLFGCRASFKYERQIKGIFYEPTIGYYIFVNNYYYTTNDDLLDRNFLMNWTGDKSAKRIEFKVNRPPAIERLSMQYIKNLERNAYLTVNAEQTHNIYFDGRRVSAELAPERLAHRCRKQTLQVGIYSFCFDERTYFFASDNEFRTFANSTVERNISELFNASSVDYGTEETLKLIFNYASNKVVLMTVESNYVIDRDLFQVERRSTSGQDFVLRISKPTNGFYSFANLFGSKQIYKTTNCLLTTCSLNDLKREKSFLSFFSEFSSIERPRRYWLPIGILFCSFSFAVILLLIKSKPAIKCTIDRNRIDDLVAKSGLKFNGQRSGRKSSHNSESESELESLSIAKFKTESMITLSDSKSQLDFVRVDQSKLENPISIFYINRHEQNDRKDRNDEN